MRHPPNVLMVDECHFDDMVENSWRLVDYERRRLESLVNPKTMFPLILYQSYPLKPFRGQHRGSYIMA